MKVEIHSRSLKTNQYVMGCTKEHGASLNTLGGNRFREYGPVRKPRGKGRGVRSNGEQIPRSRTWGDGWRDSLEVGQVQHFKAEGNILTKDRTQPGTCK